MRHPTAKARTNPTAETRFVEHRISTCWAFALVLALGVRLSAEAAEQDPYWFLIHDRAMLAELKLSETQRQALRKVTDELDGRFMALRGKTAEQGGAELQALTREARARLEAVLRPEQHRRLNEVSLRAQGTACLLREDLAEKLALSAEQRKKIAEIIGQTKKSLKELEEKGEPASAEKERTRLRTEEQTRILELFSKQQQTRWRELVGAPFDTARLGRGAFKGPELAAGQEWLNSRPLTLAGLRGQVVAVHFYACGCINCIRNYQSYRHWQEEFEGRPFTLVGIHTPETSGERVVETVRKKAREEKLSFPIVIDNDKANWSAWGNTMWPTVYLVDKEGYVRYWWMGELNWQGAGGEKLMRQRIEELLAE